MIKKSKDEYGVIVNCTEANVLDSPEKGSPIVCQLPAGKRVKIIAKPNRYYVTVQVSPAVVGFASKEFIKAE